MEPTLVVIGREPCESSHGLIALGEMVRLPVAEAIQLSQANKVQLGNWQEQQLSDPEPAQSRGRYRRRDLRAEE